jgi:hypothetical protein
MRQGVKSMRLETLVTCVMVCLPACGGGGAAAAQPVAAPTASGPTAPPPQTASEPANADPPPNVDDTAPPAEPPADPPSDPSNASGVSFSGGKGTSCADAVVVHAPNEMTGVPAEYVWLDQHYPGYTRKMQALIQCGSRPADQLSITTADGKDIEVFFDIGEYFGKF